MDGQIRFEYGYVRTWKFVNSERKSCGFKSIRIRVDGAGVIIFLGKLALIKKPSSSEKCVLSDDPGKVDSNFFCYAGTVLSPHRNVLIFAQGMHKLT